MATAAFPVVLALGAILLAMVELGAYEFPLTPRAVTEAITLGQSRLAAARATFHRPYRVVLGRAPVDYIEIVTPFRRVALAAEARDRAGERLLSQREAFDIVSQAGDVLEIQVELTFHPLNTYIGVPPFTVTLVTPERSNGGIAPRDLQRVPRFGMRLEGLPFPFPSAPSLGPGSQPLTGGTVVATFNRSVLQAGGIYDIVIAEMGKELSRARIDLARLR